MGISLRLYVTGFPASIVWINRFKRRHNLTYRLESNEFTSINQPKVDEWKRCNRVKMSKEHLAVMLMVGKN